MLISSTRFERASETLLRHLAQSKGDHLFRLALFNGDGRAPKPAAAVGRTKSNNRRVAWQKRKRVSRSRKSWKAPNRSCVPSDSFGIRRVEHKKFGSCFERLAAPGRQPFLFWSQSRSTFIHGSGFESECARRYRVKSPFALTSPPFDQLTNQNLHIRREPASGAKKTRKAQIVL